MILTTAPEDDPQSGQTTTLDRPKRKAASAADDLTRLLNLWSRGDEAARATLARRILPQLRRLAARQLKKERGWHTLQPTALVNEVFIKLMGQKALRFECRGQFFAFSAQLMRRILMDYARAHLAEKRGAGQEPLPLDAALTLSRQKSDELLRLDEALKELARFNPDGAQVVEMRYFIGLTHQEIADALEVSNICVRRRWTEARAWLYLHLNPAPEADGDVDSRPG